MAHLSFSPSWVLGLCGLAGAWAVQAASITQVTPQGVSQSVQQVVVQTSANAVPLGNPQAAAPVQVQCTPQAAGQGQGRWNSPREWVWQFAQRLPPGTRCQVQADKGFQLPSGEKLHSAASYAFEIEGPVLERSWPSEYERIDEQQTFVLRLNGAATPQSLQQQVYCRAGDVGERIAVRLLPEAQKQATLQALGLDEPGDYIALTCNRRLTAGSQLQLVYGAGVQMPNGVQNKHPQTLEFRVREAFSASQQCQRERASAGCLPIRDVVLTLTAPVPMALAQQAYLEALDTQAGGQKRAPVFDKDEGDSITTLRFPAPFEPLGRYQLVLPAQLQDDSGRSLVNASAFPLTITMGDAPALAKFAAAPFGVLERFADGAQGVALLPLTVRNVEAMDGRQEGRDAGAQIRSLRLDSDADIIRGWNLRQRYERGWIERAQARRDVRTPLPPAADADSNYLETRTVSLLTGRSGVQAVNLPQAQAGDPRPFEVVGIPLQQPGFHVLEVDSPRLGAALLDERQGAQRRMFVRTSALVTNLAVHLKLGQEGSAVWVTTLDKGQPVEGAQVQISDCHGNPYGTGLTNAQGLLLLPELNKDAPRCDAQDGWLVSARHTVDGVQDMAFVWSDWQSGIEAWRFHVPTTWSSQPESVAHTVLDRNLVRAGEAVSMKHFVRLQNLQGLALPRDWPTEMVITHVGSGQQYRQALQWNATHNGGRNALSRFGVPPAAKLGLYTVELRWPDTSPQGERTMQSGQFRVEAFRLPVFQGQVQVSSKPPLIQPAQVPVSVQLHFLNGGGAAGVPVQVSALLRDEEVAFERWSGYRFDPPRAPGEADYDSEADTSGKPRWVADKLPVTLDPQGQAQLTLPSMAPVKTPQQLVLEATFADPNGEIQTLRSSQPIWPAAVLAGLRTEGWMSVGRKMRLQALAVDTQGRPQAGVPLKVEAVQHTTTSTRKRLVGGFYTYDNQRSSQNLGEVCRGTSDARGLLLCEVQVQQAGEVELVVTAKDEAGRTSQAADTVWVTGQGELWFGGQDHDRMDVLLDKTSYAPGETAKFQVRMPFREATALVSVEREGILHTEVVTLQGKDATFELPVQAGWGPNVYVSVLALRGRVYEVPWYSFFTWGYHAPRQWWQAFWHDGKAYEAPTALVDLSKPAFRLGVAELRVDDPSHQLQVTVQADQARYKIRDKARITIRATLPNGQPAAHAEVALAAVDQALLELSPNTSWDLRQAMWQRRGWGVETATAQMEIVGRRHYGRKAAAPGGGGGAGAPTRELLDTLLLWNPRVQLDAQGQAVVAVPLNDALTSFVIAAVADDGVQRFGTGSVTIHTAQDLQVISGLPPVVREGDRFQALLTLRNSTDQTMRVQLQPQAEGVQLPAQTVEIPAQASREVRWQVQVPVMLAQRSSGMWRWQIDAQDSPSGAQDSVVVTQRVLPAVPLAVQQATIVQLDGDWTQSVAWPDKALPGQGGVRLELQSQLADAQQGVPGLRAWWAAYPYSCLEQTVGKAIGLHDTALWQRTMEQLPSYLDDDGLAMYFPPQDAHAARGSDSLTAYLLQVNAALHTIAPDMQLPAADRARMESGLIALVEGRIARDFWSPRQDLDVRKLSAIAALALSGRARPAMLESIPLTPALWPTHTVIDWLTILQAMPQIPERAARLEAAQQVLRQRLSYQGSQVGFTSEAQDQWWWLMQNTDVNVARLLLSTLGDPAWDGERVRLVVGLLARQKQGAWGTTTANTWAGLALRAFSQRYERDPVSGQTTAQLGTASQTLSWEALIPSDAAAQQPTTHPLVSDPEARTLFLPWGHSRNAQLQVQHHGTGRPWVGFQSIAAVPRTQAMNAGYTVHKTITPVQGPQRQAWQRGDVVRVRLEVQASADMTWVALRDPIPAGATILGSGLGRDAALAVAGEHSSDDGPWPAFVERGQDSYRVYWEYLPQGRAVVEYTLRLNNVGDFAVPPTRVEALYAPDMFGEWPNPRWRVEAAE